ncbi:MAG TPA: tetratricopeptide repeat protein [Acidobacteriaceae bacterium]|jgi:tetratricopeptide (TPR) repeat protein
MARRIALLLLLISANAAARDNAPAWVEVRSAHFTVVTDAGEQQGRHVADQFERMRWVFHTLFPKNNIDPVAPIVVIAAKNEHEFKPLEPTSYLAKGQVSLAGLFLRAPDKNYILVRLDAQEEHPFASVYHEYTHLELGTDGMSLWLNEGLAEFFQNTDFRDKQVLVGRASAESILFLMQHSLIPLRVLFQVDANSPYYHEEQKGSVFYTESWALTHYLEFADFNEHTNRIGTYIGLMAQNEDPVRAATEAFGDLDALQKTLEAYIRRGQYMAFTMNSAGAPIDPASLTVTLLTRPQADAVRADFLVHTGRSDDARPLLDAVLKADPDNEPARETMGLIELRAGHRDEAKKWYEEARALDPASYLAQFEYGAVSLAQDETGAEVETSLRTAIKLNARFAPAYDGLAVLYGRRREKLDQAYVLELQAVALDPGNVNYRLDTANILVEQERYDDAMRVLKAAEGIARNPLENNVVARVMNQVQQREAQAEQWKKQRAEEQVHTTVVTAAPLPGESQTNAAPNHATETPHGPNLFAEGVIHSVHCSGATMELKVEGAKGSVSLFSNDAYKIDYRALNFAPQAAIHPCADLEGMKARVHYFATADKTVGGQITVIALSK